MFDVDVTDEQKEYVAGVLGEHDFGHRGYGDGNASEQFTGILGQTVFADLYGFRRPNGEGGFDGGFDFKINGKKVDIKTMTRTVSMRNYFVHNFIAYQKLYDVDYYVFASYNKTTSVLTICGYVSKQEFFERADFYEKGQLRYRSDGTSFPTKAPLYEIRQDELNPIRDRKSLLTEIK